MKIVSISLMMTLSLFILSGCGGSNPNLQQKAKKVAEKYIYEGDDAASELMKTYEEEFSDDEMSALQEARDKEVERLMAELKAAAETFAERTSNGETDDIAQLREDIVAYKDGLSAEAQKKFMEYYSDAVNKLMEQKMREL